jgi:hypothetical protein
MYGMKKSLNRTRPIIQITIPEDLRATMKYLSERSGIPVSRLMVMGAQIVAAELSGDTGKAKSLISEVPKLSAQAPSQAPPEA